jgi:hypothetical protein
MDVRIMFYDYEVLFRAIYTCDTDGDSSKIRIKWNGEEPLVSVFIDVGGSASGRPSVGAPRHRPSHTVYFISCDLE